MAETKGKGPTTEVSEPLPPEVSLMAGDVPIIPASPLEPQDAQEESPPTDLDPRYAISSWSSLVKISCNECRFDTVAETEEEALQKFKDHYKVAHVLDQPVAPNPNSGLVVADRFGNVRE